MDREVLNALTKLKVGVPPDLHREVLVLEEVIVRGLSTPMKMPDGLFSDNERMGSLLGRQMRSVVESGNWNATRQRLQQEMIDAATRVLAHAKAAEMAMTADGIKVTIKVTSAPRING